MQGIFASHVFSGFGQLGLGLVNLDSLRASLITQGKAAADIDNIMAWAQKLHDLEAKIGDSAARNSTTDATYAHYLLAQNPGVKLTTQQQQAISYEAQQAYQASHPNPQVVSADKSLPVKSDDTTVVVPGAPAPKSKMPYILGGVALLAVVGGVMYLKMGKKKAAAA